LTTKDASDWHALTQNNEYLKLSSQRLSEPPLIWVNQFTQLINDFIGDHKGQYVINDIGCNVVILTLPIEELISLKLIWK